MSLLLDTCTFLWLACGPARISASAKKAINDPANKLFLSAASIWEITIKYRLGKMPLPDVPRVSIPHFVSFFQLQSMAIEEHDLYLSGELPSIHSDPFDRLIAAQAINRNIAVVTSDALLKKLGAKVLW